MRSTAAIGLAALLFCFWTDSAVQSQPAECKAGPGAIGVSRTVEIDASAGPRFGRSQYRDFDFLKDGEVVLTFDDGPSRRHTPAILDALDAHCTKAIFFSVGRMAVADPELLQETAMRGHTIGSHTWSHKNLRSLSFAQAKAEVELGLSAVQAALGSPVAPFFRFPYLSDPQAVRSMLEQRGIAAFSIDADSYDFRTSSAQTVKQNILNQLAQRKKGILLFHDIQPSTARGLKGLLDELKARGYRVVHVVPKAPATTLPDFDEMAEQVLKKKQVAASDDPLGHSVSHSRARSPDASRSSPQPQRSQSRSRYGEEMSWKERVFRN